MEYVRINTEGIDLNVSVFVFDEDGHKVVYCPSLDIVGSGLTEEAARQSFKITLESQLQYMTESNTLVADLESRGWHKHGQGLVPPDLLQMANRDSGLGDMINSKDFTKSKYQFNVASYA